MIAPHIADRIRRYGAQEYRIAAIRALGAAGDGAAAALLSVLVVEKMDMWLTTDEVAGRAEALSP